MMTLFKIFIFHTRLPENEQLQYAIKTLEEHKITAANKNAFKCSIEYTNFKAQ